MHSLTLFMGVFMKSLVLLTYLTLSPGTPSTFGPAEFFDNETSCKNRMQEIRRNHTTGGNIRCTCNPTVGEISAEGNNAL